MNLYQELSTGPKLGECKKDIANRMYAEGKWSHRTLALHLGVARGTIAHWLGKPQGKQR